MRFEGLAMTRDEITRINWTRVGTILGALVAFVVLLSALRGAADERYVQRTEHDSTMVRLDGKLDRILDAVCESDAKRVCR